MLNEFKEKFFGGTRLNRFFVTGRIPFANKNVSRFHIRATQIPQLPTTTMSYDYRGRKAHYPGEKSYSPWSISIIDDVGEGNLWQAFQQWQNELNDHNKNLVNNEILNHNPDNFKTTWTVNHINLDGDENRNNLIKQISLYGCWPKVINPINFNMNRPNTINMFDVVLIYDYISVTDVSNQ